MPDDTLWAATNFDPTGTSEIYYELLDEWVLNQDVAEMHLHNLRNGDLLDEFGGGHDQQKEAKAVYAWRKAASFAADQCAELIDARVGNLFRTAPVREYADSPWAVKIEAFLENVDGAGTGMTTFMQKHLPQYYINGVDFVVDKPHQDGVAPITLAQEQQLGLMPYVQAFSPMDRVDWSVTSAGKFNWARYSLGTPPRIDEADDATDVVEYLTLMPEAWRLYKAGGEEGTQVLEGQHTLGVCPIVPFYYAESVIAGYERVPMSLMTRIAPIARYLLNLISQIQIDVYRNVCFMVVTGTTADKVPESLAPSLVWAFKDESVVVKLLSGEVAHIIQKVDLANSLMQAILRLGKMSDATGESKTRATSGVQVAVERTDLDNEMRATAEQLAQVEADIVWMAMSRLDGKPIDKADLGYSVKYCTNYVLTDKAARIDHAKEMLSIPGMGENVPELCRIIVTEVLDSFVHPDADVYETAKAEIDAAEFGPLGPVPEFGDEDEDETEDTPGGFDEVEATEEEDDLAAEVR